MNKEPYTDKIIMRELNPKETVVSIVSNNCFYFRGVSQILRFSEPGYRRSKKYPRFTWANLVDYLESKKNYIWPEEAKDDYYVEEANAYNTLLIAKTTLLIYCLLHNNKELFEKLLSIGADPNFLDGHGNNAVSFIEENVPEEKGHKQAFRDLVSKYKPSPVI